MFSCNALASDFEALGEGTARPSAVEYIGGSVTSPGPRQAREPRSAPSRPGTASTTASFHGYSVFTVDPANLVMEYRYSDITVPAGGTSLLERFTQPSGANDVSRQSFAPIV